MDVEIYVSGGKEVSGRASLARQKNAKRVKNRNGDTADGLPNSFSVVRAHDRKKHLVVVQGKSLQMLMNSD